METAFQPDAFQADVLAFQIGDDAPEVDTAPAQLLPWGILIENMRARLKPSRPWPTLAEEDDDDGMMGLL